MGADMNHSTKVDVIIPVYNGANTIRKCLESVLNGQDGKVNKIIVIDDGSTDNTVEVVRDMNCPLVDLICTENHGVASARNYGLTQSSADWVAFLDSDDWWKPGKLSMQLQVAQSKGADFVCSSAAHRSSVESKAFDVWTLVKGNFVATSSVLVRRSVLDKIKPVFVPNMRFAEDYLAWLKCVSLGRGYFISEQLVEYEISVRPRYDFRMVLASLFRLNLEFAKFLLINRFDFIFVISASIWLCVGSIYSLASIVKRYLS